MHNSRQRFMQHALELAQQAEQAGEVPVGAVIVYQNQIIGEGFNVPIKNNDPTAHAEIMAIRQAGQTLNNYRLVDCTLYVTLEPCAMCVGAIVHARIQLLVFGAKDPKAGAVESATDLVDAPYFNHRVNWEGGVLAEESAKILRDFFRRRRG